MENYQKTKEEIAMAIALGIIAIGILAGWILIAVIAADWFRKN